MAQKFSSFGSTDSQIVMLKSDEERRVRYIRRLRQLLDLILGKRCKRCGATEGLEVHHLKPRTWRSRDYWSNQRLLKYIEEAERGDVVRLCGRCNKSEGQPEKPF